MGQELLGKHDERSISTIRYSSVGGNRYPYTVWHPPRYKGSIMLKTLQEVEAYRQDARGYQDALCGEKLGSGPIAYISGYCEAKHDMLKSLQDARIHANDARR